MSSVREASTQCVADRVTLPTATGARDWRAAGVARAVATIASNDCKKPGMPYFSKDPGFSVCLMTNF